MHLSVRFSLVISSEKLAKTSVLGVCGSCAELGSWQPEKAALLLRSNVDDKDEANPPQFWETLVSFTTVTELIEYKFIIITTDISGEKFIEWEGDPGSKNRILSLTSFEQTRYFVCFCGFLKCHKNVLWIPVTVSG